VGHLGALAARRARAQTERERADAELREIAAQRAAELAAAEADGARRQAEQEAGRARMAELAAELDGVVAQVRQSVEQQENRERERQEQLRQELRRLVDEPLPHVPMSRAEIEAELRDIDDFLFAQEHPSRGVQYNPATGRLVRGSRGE
jgi:seryl-tRNA synthetase